MLIMSGGIFFIPLLIVLVTRASAFLAPSFAAHTARRSSVVGVDLNEYVIPKWTEIGGSLSVYNVDPPVKLIDVRPPLTGQFNTKMSASADISDPREKEMPRNRARPSTYTGECFVVKDNIDTDQIIPAEYLTLVPSKINEYEKLGSYALIGLPDEAYETRFVEEGSMKTKYPIIIAGDNFGCGSSREHAPIALGAAGARVVVAESYARIFFRNSISTGELYPYECKERLVDVFSTGQEVTIDLEKDTITNHATGAVYNLKPLGDAGPVINAGGLFPYAIQTGMITRQD